MMLFYSDGTLILDYISILFLFFFILVVPVTSFTCYRVLSEFPGPGRLPCCDEEVRKHWNFKHHVNKIKKHSNVKTN